MNVIRNRGGFTLIELLIVVSIISILVGVVVIIFDSPELLAQTKDVNRMSDLKSIDAAIDLDTVLMGKSVISSTSPNIVYISLPDKDGDGLCNEYTLPPLHGSWQYRCLASAANLTKTNGTGWIPINFNATSSNLLPTLPIDPVNNASNFYTYSLNFYNAPTLSSVLQSQRFIASNANDPNFPAVYETKPVAWGPHVPSVPDSLGAYYDPSEIVELSWNASTVTEATITGYNIYRNGSLLLQVPGTSYNDSTTGGSCVTYTYTVTAVSSTNDESAQSNQASITTASAGGGGCGGGGGTQPSP